MREIDIAEVGAAYLLQQLSQDRAICDTVTKIVTNRGRISAIVPEGTSLERALQLEAGGLMEMSASATRLTTRLRSLPKGVVLWLDVWAKPSDMKPKGFLIGDCVTYAELSSTTDVEEMSRLPLSIAMIALYLYFGATPLSAKAVLRDRSFDELAEAVGEVYVGAYDQEGWIVWTKS